METPETPESARMAQIRDSIDVLIRTRRLHHRVVERRIEGLGVHHSQHRLLMRLSCMGGAASQKDIAQALEVSPACVARTLKALSGAHLIGKAEGTDGRRREISILPEGQRVIDDSIKTFRAIDEEMFTGIPDQEIASLLQTLSKLHQNLCDMENRDSSCERSE